MKNFEQALIARSRAYTPYSNFKVGAAILLKDGSYIHGANIENASFGLSNCAERSALFSLYSQGYKKEDIRDAIKKISSNDSFFISLAFS
jgi:cytidine deaminase